MGSRSVVLIDSYNDGHHLHYASVLASGLRAMGMTIYAVGDGVFINNLKKIGVLTDAVEVQFSRQSGLRGAIERYRFMVAALRSAQNFNPTYTHFLQLDGFIIPFLFLIPRFDLSCVFATLHWASFLDQFIPSGLRGSYKNAKGLAERFILRRLMNRGLGVMVHSPKLGQMLTDLMAGKAVGYVPYPVDFPGKLTKLEIVEAGLKLRERFAIPHDAVLLLCFGGTRYDKGVDIAIKSLPYLRGNVYLLVAGKTEHFTVKMMTNMSIRLGVLERIRIFPEFVKDEEVAHYFSAANIVVIPYRNPFSGQSGPLTMAAFLGVPVVASNLLVLEESVNQYSLGNTFCAEDPKALAASVVNVQSSDAHPDTEGFRRDHCASAFCRHVADYYENRPVSCCGSRNSY